MFNRVEIATQASAGILPKPSEFITIYGYIEHEREFLNLPTKYLYNWSAYFLLEWDQSRNHLLQ